MIEVTDATAKNWEAISPKGKERLQESIQQLIDSVSQKSKEDFEALLEKIRDQAARNGLTEEILQKLLNEE